MGVCVFRNFLFGVMWENFEKLMVAKGGYIAAYYLRMTFIFRKGCGIMCAFFENCFVPIIVLALFWIFCAGGAEKF
jgi:hypothetical protein